MEVNMERWLQIAMVLIAVCQLALTAAQFFN
jgi:hypothetical protein